MNAHQLPTEAEVWIMAHKFDGPAKPSDFKLISEVLDAVPDGGILVEAEIWSVDPFNKSFMGDKDGTPMIGFQLAKIISSRNSSYPKDEYVVGLLGWRTHTVLTAKQLSEPSTYLLSKEMSGLPLSYGVGAMGMPGMTAYFGLLELCNPKPGETVLVNAASGAVGSLVGQIAKIKGCHVIGYAGSDEKVDLLKREYGFDHAFNYKKEDIHDTLKHAAPNGVDCFFDNVGGSFARHVYQHMNKLGRITQCGTVSSYNAAGHDNLVPDSLFLFVGKELQLRGFLIFSYFERFEEGMRQMAEWIREGKIRYREHTYSGFQAMPRALIEQLEGKNVGKVIVKSPGAGVIKSTPLSDDHVFGSLRGYVNSNRKIFETDKHVLKMMDSQHSS